MTARARISARLRAARRHAAGESGFTLIELLVTITVGMVVLSAVFGLLEVSFRASSRVQDRTDVVQRGRNAMEQITQELRSQTCLGPGYPALTQADNNSMTFYADLGDENFTPQQRTLTYSAGTIVERLYPMTGGTLPNVTFAATPSRTRTLITNIVPVGATPIFRYYKFTLTDPVTPSVLLTTPLSAADLATAVRIAISFTAQPLKGTANNSVSTNFENYVYVRTSDPTDPERSPACLS